MVFELSKDTPLEASYNIVSCESCGFVYADTKSTQDDYDKFYEFMSKYESGVTSGAGDSVYEYEHFKKMIDDIQKYFSKDFSFVDIGCACGGLLKEIRKRGYEDVTGIDPSSKCIEELKSSKIKGVQGKLSDLNKLEHKYDFALLSHVFEHVLTPKEAVENISKIITDNGFVYVEVPDAESYNKFDKVPFYYFDIEHINHFSLYHLALLFENSGYEIVFKKQGKYLVAEDSFYPMIGILFRKNPKIKKKSESKLDLNLRNSIIEYISNSINKAKFLTFDNLIKSQEEIIIWGAGSYTTRLLGTTDLGKCNIKYFIDNDRNKHNKTLACAKVVTPEEGLKDFCGKVLIASVLHAKQIKEQIFTLNKNIEVIIL